MLTLILLTLIFSLPGGETSWRKVIAGLKEPGERLVITGIVYKPDGKTPAPGTRITVYHTDARGIYPPEQTTDGSRPRLRGTLVTKEDGGYEVRTIRPGAYPGRDNAAHVHYVVHFEGGENRNYTLLFSDDDILSERERRVDRSKGFTGDVQEPKKDKDGVWHIRRDIVLNR
jgi:protocatechuate 3,4-dioxygenase beta subunit